MGKWILIISVLVISCKSTKNISSFSMNENQITFEKTKIKITSNAIGNLTLKGYISLNRDSLVCFKFYGPFSYEVLSGIFSDTFKIFDNFNKEAYHNFDRTIFTKAGIRIDRRVLEYILMGKVSELQIELIKLNPEILRIESYISIKKSELVIFNDSEQRELKFVFLLRDHFPKSILIGYKDLLSRWDVIIENVDISNRSKKCNFGF